MYELILSSAVIGLMWLFREKQESVTIYQGDESSLNEASEYYWLLKDNNIPFKLYFARENLIKMQKKYENFASPIFMMGN